MTKSKKEFEHTQKFKLYYKATMKYSIFRA